MVNGRGKRGSMDKLAHELELFEVIAASDAMNNARVELEDAAENMEPERWEAIRRYVFSVLEAERGRLDVEYRWLRDL
jgi:hypothetical protein